MNQGGLGSTSCRCSRERVRTAVGPGLLGTGVAGEVVAEGFASVTHLGPDSGRIWDCTEHTVLSRAPWRWASAAAPDGAHPAVLGWGSAPSPPGCARGGALCARRWPCCGLEERKVARPGGSRAGAAELASEGGSGAPRDSARHQLHRRPPSRRLTPLGWDLESWEGLAPSLGPLEAGAWLRD